MSCGKAIFEIYYPQWDSSQLKFVYKSVDLLNRYRGAHTNSWEMNIQQLKGGGVYQESPFARGRDLVFAQLANGVESVDLKIDGADQPQVIAEMEDIFDAWGAAIDYWTQREQSLLPVYIRVKAKEEADSRYAAVVAMSIPGLDNIFRQPFFSLHASVLDGVTLNIERSEWRAYPPLQGECITLSSQIQWPYDNFINEGTYNGDDIKSLFTESGGNNLLGADGSIHQSTDNGETWSSVSTAPTGNVDDFCETNTGAIFATDVDADQLLKSTDNGDSWAAQAGPFDQPTALHFGAANRQIYAGGNASPTEIWYSDDDGNSWSTWSTGLELGVTYTILEVDANTIIAGGVNGAIASYDGGTTWQFINEMIASFTDIRASLLTSDNKVVLAGTDSGGASGANVMISEDSGVNWLSFQTDSNFEVYRLIEATNGIFYGIGSTDGEFASNDLIFFYNLGIDLSGAFPYTLLGLTEAANGNILIGTSNSAGTDRIFIVDYDGQILLGPSSDCYDNIISNVGTNINLTHIKIFDDSGGAYTEILPAGSFPVDILPDPLGVDDIIYFVCGQVDYGYFTLSPIFSNLVFNLSNPLIGTFTGVWQYYDGATWSTLTTQDQTVDLSRTGLQVVSFERPSDWSTVTIDGETGYMVRFLISAFTSTTENPQQGTRDIYAPNWSFVDIPQVNGDIGSITKLVVRNLSDNDGRGGSAPDLFTNRIIMGKRKLSRGSDFNAFLYPTYSNVDLYQIDQRVVVSYGTNVSTVTSPLAPTGFYARYNPGGTEAMGDRVTWTLEGDLGRQYVGIFHAYARVQRTAGSSTDFDVQLKVIFGSGGLNFTTDSVQVQTTTAFELLDFGDISIPKFNDPTDTVQLIIQASAASGTPNLEIFDLILIPVDEWAGDFSDVANVSGSEISQNESLEVNGLVPLDIPVVVKDRSSATKAEYEPSGDPLVLEALDDTNIQRLWFLSSQASTTGTSFSWVAPPEICHLITIEKNQGYLAFRQE